MTDEVVFYTNPMSRGRIVRWILEEIGKPYRTEVLEYGTTMKAPSYLTTNPMGKVPSIRHGETVVTEAAAICTYLADAFPDARLAPPQGAGLRGPYYRWLFFAAGPIEQTISAGSEAAVVAVAAPSSQPNAIPSPLKRTACATSSTSIQLSNFMFGPFYCNRDSPLAKPSFSSSVGPG